MHNIALLLALGCFQPSDRDFDDDDDLGFFPDPGGTDSDTAGGDDTGGDGGGDGGDDGGGDGGDDTSSGDPIQDLCVRYHQGLANQSEGSWNGNVNSCDAGDVSDTMVDNALAILNTYRWLADLPPVTANAAKNVAAQECALMMHAAGSLSHSPSTSWPCYTSTGAGAAGTSNIAPAPGVSAMDMYFVDWGNATTMGHRRWFLSNSLGPIGLGSTSGFSCATVLYGSGNATKQFTAWPPRGMVPYRAISTPQGSMDSTGWTVQSDSVRLTGAEVSITSGGVNMPVTVTELLANYGSTYAISIHPSGWTTTRGATYEVEVRGSSETISYEVEVVDCDPYD